jgi:hypothetical protein
MSRIILRRHLPHIIKLAMTPQLLIVEQYKVKKETSMVSLYFVNQAARSDRSVGVALGHKSAMTAARTAQWIEQYKDPTGVGAASDANVRDDAATGQ